MREVFRVLETTSELGSNPNFLSNIYSPPNDTEADDSVLSRLLGGDVQCPNYRGKFYTVK